MRHRDSRRVKTIIKTQGPEFFKEIGSIGGTNSPNKFTTITGRQMAIKRWNAYYTKLKEERSKQNEVR